MRTYRSGAGRFVLGLSTAFGLLGAGPAHAAVDPYDGNWRFTFAPYLWLPSIDGTLHFDIPGAGSPDVGMSAGDILSKLDFAFMAEGEIRKGNWSLFTDFIYLNLSSQNATVRTITGPGGLVQIPIDVGSQTGMRGYLWTLAASYTLVRLPAASLDVMLGFRDAQFKASLDWQLAGPLGLFPQSGSFSQTAVIWDALVAIKGRIRLSESGAWFLPYYVDVGKGSSSFTWQTSIGVGYAFGWGDLNLNYRYLYYDTEDNKLIDDLSLSGPELAMTFRF